MSAGQPGTGSHAAIGKMGTSCEACGDDFIVLSYLCPTRLVRVVSKLASNEPARANNPSIGSLIWPRLR